MKNNQNPQFIEVLVGDRYVSMGVAFIVSFEPKIVHNATSGRSFELTQVSLVNGKVYNVEMDYVRFCELMQVPSITVEQK